MTRASGPQENLPCGLGVLEELRVTFSGGPEGRGRSAGWPLGVTAAS